MTPKPRLTQKDITLAQIRCAAALLKKFSIKPEPCGCIRYKSGVVLTCEAHTIDIADFEASAWTNTGPTAAPPLSIDDIRAAMMMKFWKTRIF